MKTPKAESTSLVIEQRKLSAIKPYPNNPRKRTPQSIQKIAASIKEFGWQQPIVVDAKGVIIIGHGRYEAAKYLRLATAPVTVAKLSEEKARALRIMDNRSAEESDWDQELLNLELGEFSSKFDFKLTGLDTKELVASLSIDGWDRDESEEEEEAPAGGRKKSKALISTGDDLQFKVVVTCESEDHQGELLERFKQEGLTCKALIA